MSYEKLGGEYYDASLHPTCRNFLDASSVYISSRLSDAEIGGLSIDIGAGRSLLAELLLKRGEALDDVVLLDSSPAMLAHSAAYRFNGAHFVVADAISLPLRDQSASLIAVSLGDAFNAGAFWREVRRCLAPDGVCLFTTPAYEWATPFRTSVPLECEGLALFQRANGKPAYVPSIVYSLDAQRKLIERAGLTLYDASPVSLSQIPYPHSRKILIGKPSQPVVMGYTVVGKP